MSVLQSILTNSARPTQPFVLLQSSSALSSLPLIFTPAGKHEGTRIVDCTEHIPHFHEDAGSYTRTIFNSIRDFDVSHPLTVVIDSVDTLLSNESGSVSSSYLLLTEIFSAVRKHKGHSRMIVHGVGTSSLMSLLCQPSFSTSLVHLIAHPPALLNNLAVSYSTPPPPLTAPEKFWSVFSPIAEREYESNSVVYGSDAEGYGGNEIAVEVVTRSSGEGRRRGVERVLEGWISEGESAGPCDLQRLESLAAIWARKSVVVEAAPDPTKNASFNLSLTPAQQGSRAQVPLPYAHDDSRAQGPAVVPEGSILYDPDSADDIDDDDPDEDLDI